MTKKTLTVKQQTLLNSLDECNGDITKAAIKAGYSPSSIPNTIKSLKTEIIDYAETILAQSAPKAAIKLTSIMDTSAPIPQASIKLQAAQTILDRVGLGKTDRLDINVSSPTGLFILPAKKETIIEGEYAEN